MTPIQLLMLAALALIALSIALSAALLIAAFLNYRKQNREEKSLLTRLEHLSTGQPSQPRKKYYVDWSPK